MSVISDKTDSVVATIDLQGIDQCPSGIGIDPEDGHVFVSDGCLGSHVTVISDANDSVLTWIPVDTYASGWFFAYDANNTEMVLTSDDIYGPITFLWPSNNTVVQTLPGPSTIGVAYDPDMNAFAVAGPGNGSGTFGNNVSFYLCTAAWTTLRIVSSLSISPDVISGENVSVGGYGFNASPRVDQASSWRVPPELHGRQCWHLRRWTCRHGSRREL